MKKKIKFLFRKILLSNSSDFEVTLGFGLGIMVGFIPLYGFHTIICILLAIIIPKANRLSLILASQIFIPPVMAVALGIDYFAGSLILYRNISFMRITKVDDLLYYIKPIFAGSIIAAPLMGLLSSIVFYYVFKKIRKRRMSQMTEDVYINNKDKA
ncbi:MAG: DUF2062 domain-containing protein [bacterium]